MASTLTPSALIRALNLADLPDPAAALLNLGLVNAQGDLVTEGLIPGTGTAAELANTVGAVGEILYATDTRKLAIGDGTTAFANLPWANADTHSLTVLSTDSSLTLPASTAADVQYNITLNASGGVTLPIILPATVLGQRTRITASLVTFRQHIIQNPRIQIQYSPTNNATTVGEPILDAPSPGTNAASGGFILEYLAVSSNTVIVTFTTLATSVFDAWALNNNGGGV